ncbi:hypothetical protein ZIOFF_065738 [Zingiber officinale]|uniref:BHLH domain-containing protein n=1 Tax=Zingiber officinale TaxID=94328 RepID=A0A8J5F1I8_ZINOF|nr:hypothetical protein ZIOFF_065738 [Zingiber officinale]
MQCLQIPPSSGTESSKKKRKKQEREGEAVTEKKDKRDYIRVRARRGQATDSHSLAERARREKIDERMKCLQGLVPGCNEIMGKASVLDEIINYVQSLQSQIEVCIFSRYQISLIVGRLYEFCSCVFLVSVTEAGCCKSWNALH